MNWRGVVKTGAKIAGVYVLGVAADALKDYLKAHARRHLDDCFGKAEADKGETDE